MRTLSFEKLKVWQKSLELSEFMYHITRRYPKERRFVLIRHMSSASVSVVSNISEGSDKRSGKKKACFTEMAYSSALEIITQTILSFRPGFVSKTNYDRTGNNIGEITVMLNALHKAQIKNG